MILQQEVLNFHITVFIRRTKVLETGKHSVVYAHLGNEIHFDSPDKTGFWEQITSLSVLQRHATRVKLCDNNSN